MVQLSELDQQKIAVSLRVAGRLVVLRGVGAYESDMQLGKVLRIRMNDGDSFEVVLKEDEWTGDIIPRTELDDCDYLVPLTQSALATS